MWVYCLVKDTFKNDTLSLYDVICFILLFRNESGNWKWSITKWKYDLKEPHRETKIDRKLNKIQLLVVKWISLVAQKKFFLSLKNELIGSF